MSKAMMAYEDSRDVGPTPGADDNAAVPVYRTRALEATPSDDAGHPPDHGTSVDDVLPRMYAAAGRAEPRTVGATDGHAGSDSDTTQMAPIVVPTQNMKDAATAEEEVGIVKDKKDKYNEPMETELDAVMSGTGRRDTDPQGISTANTEFAFSDTYGDSAETDIFGNTTSSADTEYLGPGTAAGAGAGLGATAGTGGFVTEETVVEEAPEHRRGTTDLGLLLLRLGVGGLLLIHGLATYIGLGGSMGLGELQDQYISWGWSYAVVVAVTLPAVEIIAGVLLVFGLATPLGAALALFATFFQMLAVASDNSAGWNFLDGDNGAQLQLYLILTVAALALQFTGPGTYGLDYSRTWSRRPLVSSWVFVIVAVAASVAAWWFVTGGLPFVG